MPVFHHDGIRFYYEREGRGPTVVFCHGLTGDSQAIRRLLGDFDGYDLVLWDCRGHGRTEPVGRPDAFSFHNFAADLHALLEHLQIEQAVVGGVSMGAGISTRFALNWPELVRALVLVRPAWLDQPSPEPLRVLEEIGKLLEEFGPDERQRKLTALPLFQEVQTVDPQAAAGMLLQLNDPQAVERRVRLCRMPRDCPISGWHEVERLMVPALVIGCEPDYVHPLSYAMEWRRRLPQAELVEVPAKGSNEAAHNEAVRRATKLFIRQSMHIE